MKHIFVTCPRFNFGGAESVAARIIECSTRIAERVSLLTIFPLEIDELNVRFGTEIDSSQIEVISIFAKDRRFLKWLLGKSQQLQQHILMRYFKLNCPGNCLPISAIGEFDFGRPGIQYVHYPQFGNCEKALYKFYGLSGSFIRKLNRFIGRRISNYSEERMLQNQTLSNSTWSAAQIKAIYGIQSTVLYPPVFDNAGLKWETRHPASFLIVARLVKEKRIADAIDVLNQVRDLGVPINLTLVTSPPKDDWQTNQAKQWSNLPWVKWVKEPDSKELQKLYASHRYGLSMMVNEHFGMYVAELVSAGAIPFVHNSGGQIEIVRSIPDLTFESNEDAAKKISILHSSPERQKTIRLELEKQKEKFTLARFQQTFQEIVTSSKFE